MHVQKLKFDILYVFILALHNKIKQIKNKNIKYLWLNKKIINK